MDVLTDPWSWWVEPFTTNPFMQRALVAAVLAVLCTSVVGTWVVLRGMSFIGDALAHGVLPGVAIAFILGGSTTVGALVAAAVMVLGINVVRSQSPLPEDTGIGLLFVGMLALSIVILSSHDTAYAGDLSRFLFGSITGVERGDIWHQLMATAVTLAGTIVLHRPLLVLTFDETEAQLMGFRPRLTHALLLALIAIAIVASFETVGNLLVYAFLIAPPATAALLVRRVPLIMATAVVLGAFTATVGILISYHAETAAGATMALCSVVLFFVVLAARRVVRVRARP